MAKCGMHIASTLGLSIDQFNCLVNSVIEALTDQPGRFICAVPELGTFAFAVEKLGSVLYSNREKQRSRVVELIVRKQYPIDPEMAKNCLNKLSELSSQVNVGDIIREMQTFAEARNSITHHRVKDEVFGAKVLEGIFFGLRVLD